MASLIRPIYLPFFPSSFLASPGELFTSPHESRCLTLVTEGVKKGVSKYLSKDIDAADEYSYLLGLVVLPFNENKNIVCRLWNKLLNFDLTEGYQRAIYLLRSAYECGFILNLENKSDIEDLAICLQSFLEKAPAQFIYNTYNETLFSRLYEAIVPNQKISKDLKEAERKVLLILLNVLYSAITKRLKGIEKNFPILPHLLHLLLNILMNRFDIGEFNQNPAIPVNLMRDLMPYLADVARKQSDFDVFRLDIINPFSLHSQFVSVLHFFYQQVPKSDPAAYQQLLFDWLNMLYDIGKESKHRTFSIGCLLSNIKTALDYRTLFYPKRECNLFMQSLKELIEQEKDEISLFKHSLLEIEFFDSSPLKYFSKIDAHIDRTFKDEERFYILRLNENKLDDPLITKDVPNNLIQLICRKTVGSEEELKQQVSTLCSSLFTIFYVLDSIDKNLTQRDQKKISSTIDQTKERAVHEMLELRMMNMYQHLFALIQLGIKKQLFTNRSPKACEIFSTIKNHLLNSPVVKKNWVKLVDLLDMHFNINAFFLTKDEFLSHCDSLKNAMEGILNTIKTNEKFIFSSYFLEILITLDSTIIPVREEKHAARLFITWLGLLKEMGHINGLDSHIKELIDRACEVQLLNSSNQADFFYQEAIKIRDNKKGF